LRKTQRGSQRTQLNNQDSLQSETSNWACLNNDDDWHQHHECKHGRGHVVKGSATMSVNVSDDTILEQVEFTYDAAGNLIETVTRQRYHNAPASQTGELKNPSETPKARVMYSTAYPDAHHLQATKLIDCRLNIASRAFVWTQGIN